MKGLTILVILVTLVVISTAGCFGFFTGYTEKAQEMTSADYAIDQYKFFIDKYNAIRQMGTMIENEQESIDSFERMHPDPSTWTRSELQSYDERVFVRNGYIQQYNKFVADYNSRMRDLTTNQVWMKPQNYPSTIPLYSRTSYVSQRDPALELPPR